MPHLPTLRPQTTFFSENSYVSTCSLKILHVTKLDLNVKLSTYTGHLFVFRQSLTYLFMIFQNFSKCPCYQERVLWTCDYVIKLGIKCHYICVSYISVGLILQIDVFRYTVQYKYIFVHFLQATIVNHHENMSV